MVKVCPKCLEINDEKANNCKKCRDFLSDLTICREEAAQKIIESKTFKGQFKMLSPLRRFVLTLTTILYFLFFILNIIHFSWRNLSIIFVALCCYAFASFVFFVIDAPRRILEFNNRIHPDFLNIQTVEITEYYAAKLEIRALYFYGAGLLMLIVTYFV